MAGSRYENGLNQVSKACIGQNIPTKNSLAVIRLFGKLLGKNEG